MTVRLLGLPQDNNSSYLAGPAAAPAAIRRALVSDSANSFNEFGLDVSNPKVMTDAGDVKLAGLSGQAAFDAVYTAVAAEIESDRLVLSLGGDHSVSFPATKAHADHYTGLNIIHFDAHPDLYENMQDNPFSHASPFARLMETGQIARLVQVGVRTLNSHQQSQATRFGVEIHHMRDLSGVSNLCFDGPVYMSVDIDVLDPAFAPGVSHYEPGGLDTRVLLTMIQNIDADIIGADLVELNPDRDPAGITEMVAAKILKEMIGRLYKG